MDWLPPPLLLFFVFTVLRVNFCLAICAEQTNTSSRSKIEQKMQTKSKPYVPDLIFGPKGDMCHIGHENTRTHYDTIKSFLIFALKTIHFSVSAISKPTDLLT